MVEPRLKDSRWQTASKAEWELARHREAVVRPLAEISLLSPIQIDEAAEQLGLCRSLTYRLIARYRRRPRTSSLLPGRWGRRRRSRFLDPALEGVIHKAIKDVFLTQERPRISDLMREIRTTCNQQGLSAPNYRTVRRRLASIDPLTVLGKRYGTKAAREFFRPVQASRAIFLLPLEVVQVDHTLVDVMVVDERDRLPIGRPWLTLAIDVASRVVMGFYVSLDAPSVVSVAMVLTHAVLPKETWMADRNLDIEWSAAGIPNLLHVDNASEFDSDALVRGCEEYGIELEHRPIGRPHFGGHIERLIGTMMGAVHLLPGTTFSNTADKADYPSEKTACLTLGELERWLALQIAGVYHQSVHSALLKPPIQAWKEGLARRARPPRHPVDKEEFFLDFLPGQKRLVRRDGIRLFNIHYWHSSLSPLCGRSHCRMMVKYDPRNLSRVFLQDEDGAYWPIPYRELRFPPISFWEQREAMKRLRVEGRRAVDEGVIFETILEQRGILEASRKSARERREAEKLRHGKRSLTEMRPEPDLDYSKLTPFKVEEWQ